MAKAKKPSEAQLQEWAENTPIVIGGRLVGHGRDLMRDSPKRRKIDRLTLEANKRGLRDAKRISAAEGEAMRKHIASSYRGTGKPLPAWLRPKKRKAAKKRKKASKLRRR